MFPKYFYQCFILVILAYIAIFFCIRYISEVLESEIWSEVLVNTIFVSVFTGIIYGLTYVVNKIRGIGTILEVIPNIEMKELLLIIAILFLYISGQSLTLNSYYQIEWNEPGFASIIFVILLGPMAEELVFRGSFLRGLLSNKKYPVWLSIIGVSLLFALMHFNVVQEAPTIFNVFGITNAFVLSLVISWLFFESLNLGNAILVHCISNAISLLMQLVLAAHQQQLQEHIINFRAVGILAMLGSLLLFAFIVKVRTVTKR